MDASTTVDARGMRCPRPLIELSRAIGDRRSSIVTLLTDDPNARVDVPVWCRLRQHDLVAAVEEDGVWQFTVQTSDGAHPATRHVDG